MKYIYAFLLSLVVMCPTFAVEYDSGVIKVPVSVHDPGAVICSVDMLSNQASQAVDTYKLLQVASTVEPWYFAAAVDAVLMTDMTVNSWISPLAERAKEHERCRCSLTVV